MRILLASLLLFLSISFVSAQKITVKAEIVEMSKYEIMSCGFLTIYETYKFELINQNDSIEQIFLGVVMCPDFKGDNFFGVGKIYKIELKKCFEGDECYVDERYENSKLPIYTIEEITILD